MAEETHNRQGVAVGVQWSEELVEDLTREVFDIYFHAKYSADKWKKTLEKKRRTVGMQVNQVIYDSSGKPLLNKTECGRLSHILGMTPREFSDIFGVKINASNIPSNPSAFCKQSDNDRNSNIYRLCKNIFLRHGIILLAPNMTRSDIKWERREFERSLAEEDEADSELIAMARERMQQRSRLRTKCIEQYEAAIDNNHRQNTETSNQTPLQTLLFETE